MDRGAMEIPRGRHIARPDRTASPGPMAPRRTARHDLTRRLGLTARRAAIPRRGPTAVVAEAVIAVVAEAVAGVVVAEAVEEAEGAEVAAATRAAEATAAVAAGGRKSSCRPGGPEFFSGSFLVRGEIQWLRERSSDVALVKTRI